MVTPPNPRMWFPQLANEQGGALPVCRRRSGVIPLTFSSSSHVDIRNDCRKTSGAELAIVLNADERELGVKRATRRRRT